MYRVRQWAKRMICGHCSRQQPFSKDKPCSHCHLPLTGKVNSSHWNGGKGCRDKTTMARNERRKHAGSNKTSSRKSERVGPKNHRK